MLAEFTRRLKIRPHAALFLLAIAGCAVSGCLVASPEPTIPVPGRRPIFSEISVALYIPDEVLKQSPSFSRSKGLVSPSRPSLSLGLNRYVAAGQSLASGLTKVARAYFPLLTVYNQPPLQGAHDLLIKADLKASVESKEDIQGMSLQVKLVGSVDLFARDGSPLSSLPVQGIGDHYIEVMGEPGSLFEAQDLYNLGHAAGAKATESMLRQVVQFLQNSPELVQYDAILREERAQPSGLVAAVSFKDEKSMLPNQRLDAGETGELVVQVQNQGPGAAYDVNVVISAEHRDLEVPKLQSLGEIAPGSSRTVRLPIKAGLQLTDGSRQLLVEAQEKRGYHARKALLELTTVGLVRPELQISDILLDDGGGKAIGDGDRRPSNGETVEATVFIRNTGAGDAGQVLVLVGTTTPQVEILEGSHTLDSIPAGQLRQSRFLLRLPHALTARELALRATAVEGRGEKVAQAQLARTWTVLFRSPDLDVDWRIFDGASPASIGNRDGRVGNGERIEVLLTPINRGAVEAREVKLALVSPDAGIVIRPARIDLPNLSPGTQAPPVSVTVEVPRTFQGETLILRANLEQRDFPLRQRELTLPVARSKPSVNVQLSAAPALQQGEHWQYQLLIENRGDLEARNVRIQVASRWPDLEILGEKIAALGNLLPKATALPLSLKLFAKRSAPSGRALLEVTVEQDDFATVVHEIPLEVTAEAPTVVQVEPEIPLDVRGRPSGRSTPVISFWRYQEGQIVTDGEIVLPFEIHDGAGLAHVGVTLNGRPLPLSPTDKGPDRREANRYNIAIKLDPGPNKIEVTAISFDGGSLTRSLSLSYTGGQSQVWAAVIGISRYEDSSLRLQYADTDADAIATYLRTEAGVPADHVLVLKNEEAVRRRVIETIGDWLPRQAEENDTVILYFAGHGARAEDPGSTDGLEKYLLPYDASTKSYNSTAINFEELMRQVARIRAARIILVLDTCFSGAAAGGRTVFDPLLRSRSVLNDDFLIGLAGEGTGTVLLMASKANELAFEPPDLGHGVFTYYFLESLRGHGDARPFGNGDGLVSVEEAYLYVSRKVQEKTRRAQNPQKFGGGSGEIVLGRVRAGAPK